MNRLYAPPLLAAARHAALLLALVLTLASPLSALADDSGEAAEASADTVPIIEAGREGDVLRLIAPFAPGEEVALGWRLLSMGIQTTEIRFELGDSYGQRGTLRLVHPSAAPAAKDRSASFALLAQSGGSDDGARGALAALADAIRINDEGDFWRAVGRAPAGAQQVLRSATARLLLDGVLLIALLLAVTLVLTKAALRDAPGWNESLLVVLPPLAVTLALTIAQNTTYTAWPYMRILPLAERLFEGPLLGALSSMFGFRVDLPQTIAATNIGLYALFPLATYAAAASLGLRPSGRALAALFAALMPNVLRVSHSDVWFLQSLTLGALAVAMSGAAVRAGTARRRGLAVAALVPLALAAYATRPLDILMAPVVAATALLAPTAASESRRGIRFTTAVAALLPAVGAAFLHASSNLAGGLHDLTLGRLVWNVGKALFDPRYNTLLMHRVTPPGFVALALVGVVAVWRQRGRLRSALLLTWLLGYLAAHAVAMSHVPLMQARYHLHLALPLALLAGAGAGALATRWRWVGYAVAIYALAGPAIHWPLLQAESSDQIEFSFVREAADHIPDGCAIIEYTGPPDRPFGRRLGRFGEVLDGGARRNRWALHSATGHGGEASEAARRLLSVRGRCVYYYEGLPCLADAEEGQLLAPSCADVRRRGTLQRELELAFVPWEYDPHLVPTSRENGMAVLRLFRSTR